jgi:hypothetical protein
MQMLRWAYHYRCMREGRIAVANLLMALFPYLHVLHMILVFVRVLVIFLLSVALELLSLCSPPK